MVATEEAVSAERQAQKTYWLQHSSQPTVEAMMLDSKASEIDQLERPEVGAYCRRSLVSQDTGVVAAQKDCAGQQQHSSEHQTVSCRTDGTGYPCIRS
jgi:hypothetical protein